MGYYSTISGEITINPPLRWSEVKDTKFLPAPSGDRALRIRCIEETNNTDDGEILIRRGVAIADNLGEAAKYYELEGELREILSAYPDRKFTGYIVRVGDENGDVERYWIQDGRVHSEKAALVWG